jgi:hypothetical protein
MHLPKKSDFEKDFSEILSDSVDKLCLSEQIRAKIIENYNIQTKYSAKSRKVSYLVVTCLACLTCLVYFTCFTELESESYVKSKSVIYSDQNRSNWLKSTILVKSNKNKNSYIKITVSNSKISQT